MTNRSRADLYETHPWLEAADALPPPNEWPLYGCEACGLKLPGGLHGKRICLDKLDSVIAGQRRFAAQIEGLIGQLEALRDQVTVTGPPEPIPLHPSGTRLVPGTQAEREHQAAEERFAAACESPDDVICRRVRARAAAASELDDSDDGEGVPMT